MFVIVHLDGKVLNVLMQSVIKPVKMVAIAPHQITVIVLLAGILLLIAHLQYVLPLVLNFLLSLLLVHFSSALLL
jgi:hypothetical protein